MVRGPKVLWVSVGGHREGGKGLINRSLKSNFTLFCFLFFHTYFFILLLCYLIEVSSFSTEYF